MVILNFFKSAVFFLLLYIQIIILKNKNINLHVSNSDFLASQPDLPGNALDGFADVSNYFFVRFLRTRVRVNGNDNIRRYCFS